MVLITCRYLQDFSSYLSFKFGMGDTEEDANFTHDARRLRYQAGLVDFSSYEPKWLMDFFCSPIPENPDSVDATTTSFGSAGNVV